MNRAYFRRVFSLMVFVSVAVIRLVSMPGPTLNLDNLTRDSTTIVTGEIVSLNETGKTKIQYNGSELDVLVQTGLIRADQILKGDRPSRPLTFQTYVAETPIGWASPRTNLYSVFFLQADSSGNNHFTSLYYPAFPAIPAVSTEGADIDKVIAAISGPVSSQQTTLNEKTNAIFLMSRSKSAAATSALREALKNSIQEVQLSAAGALLERNDTTGLDSVKEALLQEPQGQSNVLRHNLTVAVAQGLHDPKAIPALRQLAASTDATVRRAAASSLMHMRSPEAIASLKSLLDDTDFEARYYAVVGLAETTNHVDWRPNMDVFRADEDKYLRHWRNWSEN
jgi:HEAT repeats